jgi:signal transduction histidine kinase
MVAVPVVCLLLLWAVLVSNALGGGTPSRGSPGHPGSAEFLLVGAAGLVILAAAALMGLFARRLARDVTGLEATAQHLADEQMPQIAERLRRGEQDVAAETPMRSRALTAEIARAEEAIASLQHKAVAAAVAEAGLRNGIGQVFVSLARRNQSLLQRQLRLIDALEQKASDPATLADLFPLDHLTTRMRRHAEGLIILSGAAPGRSWSEPVPVIDVIRGAVAEVEDYKRVSVLTRAEDAVAGLAAADMIHLLAELIENATLSSPSGTRVEVRAERVANGFAIEIDDRGLGIEAGQLRTINRQLAHPPDFDLANADQLGLFVVGKLAARHGVRVSLRPSPYGGTTAVVLMPNSIVVPVTEMDADTQPDMRTAIGRPAGLDLRPADALALTGRHTAPPSSLSLGTGAMAGALHTTLPPPAFTATGQARPASSIGPARPASPLGTPGTGGPPGPAPMDGSGSDGLVPGPRTAGTYRGLPRRVRQANLNPRLRETPAAGPGSPGPADSRSPEEARDLVASLQSGWQRGRDADGQDAEAPAGTELAGRLDPEAPRNEEA